jgi:hypothetical protein
MVLISDLWVPAVWVKNMSERQATFPGLFNSGVVTRTPELDLIASGPGTSVNIPFFKDITDQSDEIQVENTAPTVDNGQPSGLMVAVPLNRVTKNSAGALAAQVSGASPDPVGQIISALTARRLKQRQTTLVNVVRGAFGSGAPNSAAPLSANRYGGTTSEIFLEAGAAPAAGQLISPTVFINTKALLGELQDDLQNGGAFWCHPNIKAALEVADALNFKTGVPSALGPITTYRGIPIFTSQALVRAGSTSGFVYDSYIVAPGVIGYGEKAQQGDTIEVASLQYWRDPDKNNSFIYDRTRFVLHINGMKWVGAPAGQSATNAELATVGNWNLVFQSAARTGIVCMRTNG